MPLTDPRCSSTNLRIYNAVIELQHNTNKLPQQVELQSPVILEDALGRKAPFHLDFVTSPKVSTFCMDFILGELGSHAK
jgi:hypothetical protein